MFSWKKIMREREPITFEIVTDEYAEKINYADYL